MTISRIGNQFYYEGLNGQKKTRNEGHQEALTADLTSLQDRINNQFKFPYSYLAENGIIEYEGVIFVCDEKNKALCLGDVTSDPSKVLTIPLSKGGALKVNRDNLGDLSKAIGMFSPEDINLIMRAIAQDAKIQQMQNELEDDKNGIGDEASEETAGGDVTAEGDGVLPNASDVEENVGILANSAAEKSGEEETRRSAGMDDVTDEMIRRLFEERERQ